MTITHFAFPTSIYFGTGASQQVGAYLRRAYCQRPLIVTDKGIAALPMLAKFRGSLGNLDVDVFGEVEGNPVASQVEAGVEVFKKHKADAVIGLGGGAA